jgi:two-component sensor histidine kinase
VDRSRSPDSLGGETLREALFREYLAAEPETTLGAESSTPSEEELLRALAAEAMAELDLEPVRRVLDSLLRVAGMSVALVSPSGKTLVSSNWRTLCSDFYRVHPETRKTCEESDRSAGLTIAARSAGADSPASGSGPYRYRCPYGFREIGQPLFIENVHWANIFVGQFLYDDDRIDEAALLELARSLGWDEAACLAALRAVPRYSHDQVERALELLVSFGNFVSTLTYASHRERFLARHFLRVERELSAALEQKDFLFAELQHRVKNSFALMASLISLQEESFDDERVLHAFDETKGRLHSISFLYERLYETRSIADIDLGAYIAESVKAAVASLADSDGAIRLETDCAPLRIDTKRAIYVGLVAHEFAVNALKHAFPPGKGGRLRVELAERDGYILLSVADDGVGLPPGFSPDSRKSLGVLVVRTLVDQLGGGASFGAGLPGGPGPGVAFTVRFPR